MDCSISIFRSRSLAGSSAHPEQGRAESNNGGKVDHDEQSRMIVEMFRDLAVFGDQIVPTAEKFMIYICQPLEVHFRLSPDSCIRDWKI